MARHPIDGLRVEQVGRVLPDRLHAGRQIVEDEEQVDAGGRPRRVDVLDGESAQGECLFGRVERQQRLEDRVAAQVALGGECLDEPLERERLVFDRVERGQLDAAQELAEAGGSRQVGPEHDRVDERPDDARKLRLAARVDRRADDEFLLAAVAREQHGVCGQRRREERGTLGAREILERRAKLRRQRCTQPGSAQRRDRWPRPVAGNLQRRRRIGELLAPMLELVGEALSGQPISLPLGEVGVLHHRRFETGLGSRGVGVVQPPELFIEHDL